MDQIPVVTIFVRHSADCPDRLDAFHKRCNCWKHVRWFKDGKLHMKATKQRTWAGAERVRRETEDSFNPTIAKTEPDAVTLASAINLFIKNKEGQNLTKEIVSRYRCELDRLRVYCESQGVYLLKDVTLPLLTSFRTTWTS